VIVYGDTNSTVAGALAVAKLKIKLVHVEAGLRSFSGDILEEINRVLTDHISLLLFCPTPTAVNNLKREGVTKGVFLTGDVMFDVFKKSQSLLAERNILTRLKIKPRGYLLLTIHCQENTDNLNSLKAILSILANTPEIIIFSAHPRTTKALERIKGLGLNNFLFTKPVSYLDMLVLEKNARKIITDSGGVQKEAYWFAVPCITLR
jgi:UDP-N-acetylglucosamine 2-epimerase (non-hydrolysing)